MDVATGQHRHGSSVDTTGTAADPVPLPPPPRSWVGHVVADDRTITPDSPIVDRRRSKPTDADASPLPGPSAQRGVAAGPIGDADRVNVSYVESPSELLPPIRFQQAPQPRRRRRRVLHRLSGRVLLLALIGLLSIPLVSRGLSELLAADPEPEPIVVPRATPPLEVVVHSDAVHVQGTVPTEEVRSDVVTRVEALIEDVPVVDSLEVDPAAVIDVSTPTPLRPAETIRFESGQTEVVGRYRDLLETAAAMVRADETVTVSLVGHTDSIGRIEDNLALSVERAERVGSHLMGLGIDGDQIQTSGRGEAEPIESNETSEGRAANRRVEFFIDGLLAPSGE